MGLTAENVAERWDVSREDMDRFAQRSQERAVAAQATGFFDRELTPYEGRRRATTARAPTRRSSGSPRSSPRSFPDGKVTAGNACPLNDGAAAVLVMSETRARGARDHAARADHLLVRLGRRARDHGRRPDRGLRKVLDAAGMTIDDVDVMELNEAFAAQVIPVCRELGVDPFGEKLNPHGGAIALGHPYGMTGARIMCTLLNGLDDARRPIGLETMCVGGGQGMAMLVERLFSSDDLDGVRPKK